MTLQRIEQSLKYSTSKSIVVEVWNTSTLDLFRFENMIELFSCLILLRPHVNNGSHARWELRNEKINRLI